MDKNGLTSALFKVLDTTKNIDAFIERFDSDLEVISFHDYANQLAKEKNFSIPMIINSGSLNESYCYQIFKGKRKPSRDKTIQVCFAMGLSLEESNKMLRAAEKNELYCRNKRDAIFIYGINNHLSVLAIEEMLLDRELETLINVG